MEILIVAGFFLAVFGALGYHIAAAKGRDGAEGAILGVLLGPIGLLVAVLMPTVAPAHRPAPAPRPAPRRDDDPVPTPPAAPKPLPRAKVVTPDYDPHWTPPGKS